MPLAGVGVALMVLMASAIRLVAGGFSANSASLWGAVVSLVFIVAMLCQYIPAALRYTWPLCREEEPDAAVLSGELQEIIPVPYSPRYTVSQASGKTIRTNDLREIVRVDSSSRHSVLWPSGRTVKAVLLRIGGQELYCMSAEGLTVGKRLVVHYLPRSRVVLSWRIDLEDFSPFDM